MGDIISLVSGKGGVGKTFISINLAYALSNVFNKRVVLIDGNVTTPNVSINLNILDFTYTIHDVLAGRISITDSIINLPYKFDVVVGSLSLKDLNSIDLEKWGDVLEYIKPYYDYIIIDSSAGIGREVYHILEHSDNSIIVTTPDKSSVMDSYRVIKLSEYLNTFVLGTVLNRYSKKLSLLRPSFVEKFTGYPILSVVYEDSYRVRESLNNGVPYLHIYKDNPTAKGLLDLASKIAGEPYVIESPKKSFAERLLELLGIKK